MLNTLGNGVTPATIHARFAAQVRRSPEAVALCFGTEEVNYRTLGAASDKVAERIRERMPKHSRLVGLSMARSPNLIVYLLGILKAGFAYVPIDPALPADRKELIVEDAGLELVVTDENLSDQFGGRVPILVPGDTAVDAVGAVRVASGSSVYSSRPQDLAYVIYTSGSTGRPKGCAVSHQNVVRLFDETAPYFNFTHTDVHCLFHSYGFDFSVWEIWGALLHGGRLVILGDDEVRDPDQMHATLRRAGITILNATPTAFLDYFVDQRRLCLPLHQLRTVVFGGEKLTFASLAPWFATYGDRVRMVNMYGITETTVHVTYREVRPEDTGVSSSLIGATIPDMSLAILDDDLTPAANGEIGELCVGGGGVSWGYRGKPRLTADRFVPDPNGNGTRLYRSGDLGRTLADGQIEYLGRGDMQVKIRGYRIELGEIEAALMALHGIERAVVTAENDGGSNSWLAAFCVAPQGLKTDQVRAKLAAKLPDYMVPSEIRIVSHLPLTINGKIDKDALRRLAEHPRQTSSMDFKTATERKLVKIWRELINASTPDPQSHFFRIGGHSLLAMRLTGKVEAEFGLKLSIAHIQKNPVLRDMAQLIDTQMAATMAPEKVT
jgi:amino acid adenylation domain-containing protein